MEEQEIIKGNVSISEFMGASVFYESDIFFTEIKREYAQFEAGNNPNPHTDVGTKKQTSELSYHQRWEWIMPVVEKISLEHDISISSVGMWACYITRSDSDYKDSIADFGGFEPMIMNVWNCVVKYIQWRNKQPKYKQNG